FVPPKSQATPQPPQLASSTATSQPLAESSSQSRLVRGQVMSQLPMTQAELAKGPPMPPTAAEHFTASQEPHGASVARSAVPLLIFPVRRLTSQPFIGSPSQSSKPLLQASEQPSTGSQ